MRVCIHIMSYTKIIPLLIFYCTSLYCYCSVNAICIFFPIVNNIKHKIYDYKKNHAVEWSVGNVLTISCF